MSDSSRKRRALDYVIVLALPVAMLAASGIAEAAVWIAEVVTR